MYYNYGRRVHNEQQQQWWWMKNNAIDIIYFHHLFESDNLLTTMMMIYDPDTDHISGCSLPGRLTIGLWLYRPYRTHCLYDGLQCEGRKESIVPKEWAGTTTQKHKQNSTCLVLSMVSFDGHRVYLSISMIVVPSVVSLMKQTQCSIRVLCFSFVVLLSRTRRISVLLFLLSPPPFSLCNTTLLNHIRTILYFIQNNYQTTINEYSLSANIILWTI